MSVLRIENLNVCYQAQPIIQELELKVEQGEIMALFGPSGGGKSTVLKAVAGLLEDVSGNIHIGDACVLSARKQVPPEQRHIGLIFQDYALFPHLTVAENIAFGLTKLAKQERASKVQDMLALIKMTQYAERFPHELSGGQQQRIAIVRALACEPSLLLFDEAFSNIDPQFRFELIADIRALLKAQNIAALFVTHNQDEAFAFCDRIAVLNRGRIEQVGKAEALFRAPKTKFIAEFLGDGVWLSAQVQGGDLLSSELGSLTYRGEQDLTALAGKEVELYLRPHQLSLTADDKSHIRVEQERFVGGGYESILMLSDQHLCVHTQESFLNQTVAVRVNATVTCVFPKSA